MKEQEWDQSGVGNMAEHKQYFGFIDFIIHGTVQVNAVNTLFYVTTTANL
jgi:hypothetical protein